MHVDGWDQEVSPRRKSEIRRVVGGLGVDNKKGTRSSSHHRRSAGVVFVVKRCRRRYNPNLQVFAMTTNLFFSQFLFKISFICNIPPIQINCRSLSTTLSYHATSSLCSPRKNLQNVFCFRELGIGIVAYSPLGRGFLSSGPKLVDTLPEDDFRKVNEPLMTLPSSCG